jgi:hypothetical protein
MKSFLILLCILFASVADLSAQAPQGVQYQAVIRDNLGNPLLNTPVQFRFTLENNAGNVVYYQETQVVSTNALGGISLVIGDGNASQGNFALTDWKNGDVRVRVELDPAGGQNYVPFGFTSLQSVPYALFADRAGSLVDQNGDDWGPENDQDEQSLTVNGNQLSISNGNAVVLPTGSGGDNWGGQTIVTEPELTGNGTLGSPLSISTQGASNGDVLKWNGNSWVPQDDDGQNYTAGNGIAINGAVISNTGDNDNNASNEIQTLSINGNVVSLTNGGSINLPTYNEGTGIDINGNTISATNAQAMWNANQLQSRNVSAAAPSNGQVLKWDGANWSPGTDNGGSYTEGTGINIAGTVISAENTNPLWNANQLQDFPISGDDPLIGQFLQYGPPSIGGPSAWRAAPAPTQYWSQNGTNLFYNTGNIGLGTNVPNNKLHITGTQKIQMDDQTFGKWSTVSIEFSSNLVPETDNLRDLGSSGRRWDDVYATSGIVNTSDRRDKTDIQSLSYGLDEIMKLRPVSFTWKTKPEKGTKLGLIAQELETVIPEVVSNPERTPSANSEPGTGGENRLGVYYSDLIPVLIKAIQEQEAKIIHLQEEIELLKKN